MTIRYLHTMVRVLDLEKSMAFYELLGLKETRRYDNEQGRFTLVFMGPSGPGGNAGRADLQLGRRYRSSVGQPAFRHLAYEVDDIYATCRHLMANGVTINRPPRDGRWPSCDRRTTCQSNSSRRVARKPPRSLDKHAQHRPLVAAPGGPRRAGQSVAAPRGAEDGPVSRCSGSGPSRTAPSAGANRSPRSCVPSRNARVATGYRHAGRTGPTGSSEVPGPSP